MKRTLLLTRHAKSDWGNPSLGDHKRPLNKRGQRDAPLIGTWLAEHNWRPHKVTSSDATRTRETWALLAKSWPETIPISWKNSLYLADPQEIIFVLSHQPDDCQTLMHLGHNPGTEELASLLTGVHVQMTTANVAILKGEGDTWGDALQNPWTLHTLLRPKEI